ncbi:GntR family transcriptional regulator [Derxia gummosa]|uniref:GntR family transcriptional regulator n=1 Tax=Derxia gummosa DSM 723 TaxID=1121388 RepID=A0A8B6XAN7_9BURK|nr:GntR family transcriptional regulator [Derxia gummosa]
MQSNPSRPSRADAVARRIADDIALGHFVPGERIDEHSLAARYGVSRTPVREAIKQLAASGLVHHQPNRGSTVAELSAEELGQVFEAIGEIEAACARHAAVRMTDAERTALADLHARARAAVAADDGATYADLNLQLHAALLAGAHNPVLARTAEALHAQVAAWRRTQFRQPERMAESFAEHAEIVEAVLARDAIGAHRAMRAHLVPAHGSAEHAGLPAAVIATAQAAAAPVSESPATDASRARVASAPNADTAKAAPPATGTATVRPRTPNRARSAP